MHVKLHHLLGVVMCCLEVAHSEAELIGEFVAKDMAEIVV